MIATITTVLKAGRKVQIISRSSHKHVILGHTMELLGTALAAAKVEFMANGLLFGGALLLLVYALLEDK